MLDKTDSFCKGPRHRRRLCAIVSVLCLSFFPAERVYGQQLDRFHFTSMQMGGTWGITLYAKTAEEAKAASDLAFKRVAEINLLFSDYNDSSELSLISGQYEVDQPYKVTAEFYALTQIARDFSQASDGAFDVSIGPLTQLWRRAYRKRQFPVKEIWDAAHAKVGFKYFRLDPCQQTITFQQAGMKLDFGAIAKGYAADQALKVLKQAGYCVALVDGNGNLAAGDAPPGKEYWSIEVQQFVQADDNSLAIPVSSKLMLVKLKNQGISTSGDYTQSITIDGQRYSHIIDPLTGRPQRDQRLVTVIAEDAMHADVLSTILCIKGAAYLEKMRELYSKTHALGSIVRKDGLTSFSTPDWEKLQIK